MATKESTRPGNIREFVLSQAKDEGKSIDISDILSDINIMKMYCLIQYL